MIRPLCLFLVTILILTASCVRNNTAALNDEDHKQLRAMRELLAQAMLEGDVEAIKRIYSDDYGLVTRQGMLRTRAERIKMLESGKLKYLNLGEETNVTINTYGKVTVVRGVVGSAETEFNGERRRKGSRRFTAIWVHEDGEWRQVGRQNTVIAAAAP